MSRRLLPLALAALAACGESSADPPANQGGQGAAAGSGQAGAAGEPAGQAGAGSPAAGAGGQGAGAGGQGGLSLGGSAGSGGGAGAGAFEQCATDTAEARPRPVDLYIMLDRSGSMVGPKWNAVTSGLDDFFANPGASDLRLGLQFFPLDGAAVCDFKAYSVPAVPVAPLSTNQKPLSEALGLQTPNGETPTLPALQGAYGFTQQWAKENPDRAVAVLLATDDEPNVCASTLDKVTQVAQNARAAEPSIATFVIGVGNLDKLDAVAAAGGTQKAFLVDGSGSSTKEQFIKALGQIRDALVVCSFPLPKVSGQALDLGKLNVTLTPPQGQPQPLIKADSPAACPADKLAWYYDPPQAPAQVTLCPAACSSLKSQPGAKIELVFGCETLIK